MKTVKWISMRKGLAVVLALAGVLAAIPVSAAPLASHGNAISIDTQDVDAGRVVVKSVTASQDGWLLIWKDANGAPGSLLGYAPVRHGVNMDVAVDLRASGRNASDNITPTLWASLAPDSNAGLPFASPDPSIMPGSSVALVGFGSQAAFAAAPAARAAAGQMAGASVASSAPKQNKMTVRRQDAATGRVVVDSVTAAQDGWLLIWNDGNGAPNSLLGFAPVRQGTTTDVSVDIRLTKRNGEDNLTPTLWATLVADPSAMTALAVPDSLTLGGSALKVAFGSSLD